MTVTTRSPDGAARVSRPHARLTLETVEQACDHLARRDTDLARIYRTRGVPPLWARPAGFRTLVRIVLEQQVSLASGRATLRRIESAFGRVSAKRLAAAGEEGLRAAGVTRQKSRYCVLLAQASLDGDLDLRGVARVADRDAMAALPAFTGIGRWTAEVYLLMALRRPDVWPAGDLALAKAMQSVKNLPERPDEVSMRRLAEGWRPYRAVAARLLWHDYLQSPKRTPAPAGA